MFRLSLSMVAIMCTFSVWAQQENLQTDTTKLLSEIVVSAYQYKRPLQEVPVSIGLVKEEDFERFNATSLLPAINTVPGVRMEERSPGSYRLSVRGSSLRSPFGVRNIKVYWNNLPFTDAGGNTYLNLFDFNSIQQAEIIKGPGASLYGAGTGGVLMLKNNVQSKPSAEAGFSVGSFGLLRFNTAVHLRTKATSTSIRYAHQEADGYREQSKMRRDVVQAQTDFYLNDRNTLAVNVLFSDLFYQTPGGLTKLQFDEDPQQARPTRTTPGGVVIPGAVDQQAAIYNETIFAGVTHELEWNNRWSTESGIYGSFTQFRNPAIRVDGYEDRTERGFGGRTNTSFSFAKGKLNFGAEVQHMFSPVTTHANILGQRGDLVSDDELSILTYFIFSQVEFNLPYEFLLTVGASANKLNVDFVRLSEDPTVEESRDFDAVFSPRVALLKKINSNLSVFGSFSQGYSPPTIQELYPSIGIFDQQLKPEYGNNIEIGARGTFFNKLFSVDFTAYDFRLKEAIVIRRDENDADYFVNAGATKQQGAELFLSWTPNVSSNPTLLKFWTSYSLNYYTFDTYEVDSVDHSGNDLTGVPRNVLVAGVDILTRLGIYANLTYTYTDRLPLNDGNTEYANAYYLLGGKAGYRKTFRKISLDFFVGVDNALNQKYSLGNDLNALGGRYYNAAPTINYFGGLKANYVF